MILPKLSRLSEAVYFGLFLDLFSLFFLLVWTFDFEHSYFSNFVCNSLAIRSIGGDWRDWRDWRDWEVTTEYVVAIYGIAEYIPVESSH